MIHLIHNGMQWTSWRNLVRMLKKRRISKRRWVQRNRLGNDDHSPAFEIYILIQKAIVIAKVRLEAGLEDF